MISSFFTFIQRYFFILFAGFSAIALYFPEIFLWGNSLAMFLLITVLYCSFLRINILEFNLSTSQWIKALIYPLLSLVVFPFLIWVFFSWISIDQQIALFLIFGMSSGMANPMLASLFGLNVAWTTIFTIISSFLVSFTLPFLLQIFFNISINFSPIEMTLFLGKMIFIPFLIAMITKYFFSHTIKRYDSQIGGFSSFLMLFFAPFILSPYVEEFWSIIFSIHAFFIIIIIIFLWIVKFLFGYILPTQTLSQNWNNAMNFGNMNIGMSLILASSFFGAETVSAVLIAQVIWIFIQIFFKKVILFYSKGI